MLTLEKKFLNGNHATCFKPNRFDIEQGFYPEAQNATIHPVVGFFFRLSKDRIINRYCHLNPKVDSKALRSMLETKTKHFMWAGADLFYTTTDQGARRMTVVETNSCPSGNKSMPLVDEASEYGGYGTLVQHSFLPRLKARKTKSKGALAVLCDKNQLEASAYAATIADQTHEKVYLVPFKSHTNKKDGKPYKYQDNQLHIRTHSGDWLPVRAAFRYVTQNPWTRIPVHSKTFFFNPMIACLAGGRNKLVASKSYEFLNADLASTGIQLRTPKTIRDVSLNEVPLWIERFGKQAVVKNPYSNAGQGVWTITSQNDLDHLMALEHHYDRFIVQALVGNSSWSSEHEGSRYYHVGTVPNKRGEIFAADIRMMVASGPDGFFPIAVYARKARKPLQRELDGSVSSWDMLGTNLSQKLPGGAWASETERLLMMDRRDFNQLGIGPDDLIEAYIQSVLSVLAIDRSASRILTKRGTLHKKLFRSLNDDDALISEIGSEL